MSKRKDDEDEEALNRSYQVGVSAGLDQAANFMMQKATEAFQRGERDAELLRSFSDKLRKMGKDAHPGIPETLK